MQDETQYRTSPEAGPAVQAPVPAKMTQTQKSAVLFLRRAVAVLLVISLVSLAAIIYLLVTLGQKQKDAVSAMVTLSDQADTMLLHDSTLGEIRIPVLAGVAKNVYDLSRFQTLESGEITYDSDFIKAYKGVDVSSYQGDIDWEKVKASGVSFAMIRIGYRGYGTGVIKEDEKFLQNIAGASKAGIKVGVYFYSQAVSVHEAIEEADFVLERIKNLTITYPVVFDWEIVGTDTARTDEVSAQMLNDCAVAFCDKIKAANYHPMIYASQKLAVLKYDLSRLTTYDFWLVQYKDKPDYYYNFQMWQYTDEGTVDGIPGKVDMNLSFQDYNKK